MDKIQLEEKTLTQSYHYRGRIINLRVDEAELPNGKPALREVVEHPGGVCVAALNERNELLFVRQYRYPYGEITLELPAGKLERGEDPELAIQRELLEETGAVGGEILFLGNLYPTPGYCDEKIRLYATRIKEMATPNPDDDEFLEVEAIPLDQAVELVMKNSIPDAKTQVLILKTDKLVASGAL